MKALIILSALIALPVFANDKPQSPSQPVAISGAAAGAAAESKSNSASSVGNVAATAGASLDASGNVSGSSNYASDFNSVALALPGLAGAAPGNHDCIESNGGRGFIGGTGGMRMSFAWNFAQRFGADMQSIHTV